MIRYWNTKGSLKRLSEHESNAWIEVYSPDEAETDYIVKELGVPDFFISDIKDIDERSRIENEEGWELIIMRIPYMKVEQSRSPYMTVPLGIAFKGDVLVTICNHETHMMNDFSAYYARKKRGFIDAVDMVFHLFLSSSVWYLKMLKQIKIRIDKAKRELDDLKISNKNLIALSRLQDSLVFFTTSIQSDEALMTKLKFKLPIDALDAELIEDVTIELNQAHISSDIYSNILQSTLDTYASIISNNMNSVMKTLTSFSIIMMFPTLIASIFGMNLINGWEQWPWGLPLILLLCLVLTGLFWYYFRRKSWI